MNLGIAAVALVLSITALVLVAASPAHAREACYGHFAYVTPWEYACYTEGSCRTTYDPVLNALPTGCTTGA